MDDNKILDLNPSSLAGNLSPVELLISSRTDADLLSVRTPNVIHAPEIEEKHLYYTLTSSKIFLGEKLIGITSGCKTLVGRTLGMKMNLSTCLKLAFECFAQCTVDANSSNSPSMLLHQLASLTFGLSVIYKCQWEEGYSGYTPDLLMNVKGHSVLVDVTSQNMELKMSQMPKNVPKIVINKYSFLSDFEDETMKMLSDWSKMNDSRDMSIAQRLIDLQAPSERRLLKDKTLKFFSDDSKFPLSLEEHSLVATEVFERFVYDDQKEIKEKISDIELNELILDFVTSCKQMIGDNIEYEGDYFIFPRLEAVQLQKMREYVEEKEEPSSFIKDGFLDYGLLSNEKEHKLFTEEDTMIIATKAYIELMDYPTSKMDAQRKFSKYYLELANKFGYVYKAWQYIVKERVLQKLGLDILDPSNNPSHRLPKRFRSQDREKIPMDKSILKNLILKTPMSLDPDHVRLIKLRNCEDMIGDLEVLRDYNELRFRSRVSLAITYNYKPEKVFRVNHWVYSNFYALVKICGLVLEKDKGVAYVSFFCEDILIRTEKWRLPDIENYSVGHNRLVCCLLSLRLKMKRKLKITEYALYGRIISENSWGLSKFLKVYRYLSSGICMGSTEIHDTLKKLLKTVDEPVKSKLSFRIILHLLESNAIQGKIKSGETPINNYSFENIGWESFLVNLCPSNTYGKFRHLESTLTELADEIDLYNNNFQIISRLYEDFDSMLGETDLVSLKNRYDLHFKELGLISKMTDGRFTFSPASIVLIYSQIKKLKPSYKEFQNSLPPLSTLMTAKASTDSLTSEPCMAIQSISKLASSNNTSSTSLLCLSILEKLRKGRKIDLTMRMFDKDQVGGDREISIMSSEMRVLQVVVERFFEKWAKVTGIDKLHEKSKVSDLISSYENAMRGTHRLCLTADQTRWGPNFNTIIFGYLAAVCGRYTTESFIPMIICFLSEYKVFEMPCWIPNLFNRSDYAYTIYGKLGRSHMGQGIFHQSSSMYHTLVIMKLKEMIQSNFDLAEQKGEMKNMTYNVDPFVTSDDVGIITYFDGRISHMTEEDVEEANKIRLHTHLLFSNIYNYFIFFGIKTSTYKNIVSDKIEFNSIHLGDGYLGNIDLKFCYSLIEPATTGNFLYDFYRTYDSYVAARNVQCSHESSVIISNCLLIKLCRQWKIDFSLIKFQSDEDLIRGIPKPYTIRQAEDKDYYHLKTPTYLRYKTRKIIEEEIKTGMPILDELLKASLKRLAGTRERTSYRSIVTHNSEDDIYLISNYFNLMSAIGETNRMFLHEVTSNVEHISDILNSDYQISFSTAPEEAKTRKSFYRLLKLRDSVSVTVDLMDLIASHYPYQRYLGGTSDQIQLHLLRKKRTLQIEDRLFDPDKTTFIEAIMISEEKIREIEMESTACNAIDADGVERELEYTKFVYYPPAKLKFIKKEISFMSIDSDHDLDLKVNYFPSRLHDISKINFDENFKFYVSRNTIGKVLPNIKVREVFVPDLTHENILGYNFRTMMENEVKYRASGQETYLNFSINSKKLPERTLSVSSVEVKGSTLTESSISSLLLEIDMIDANQYSELLDSKETELDDEQVLGLSLDDDLKRVIIEELSTVSVKISNDYGFLCNRDWCLDIIIKETILMNLIKRHILISDLKEVNIMKWKQSSRVFSFDKDFRRKFISLCNSSKVSVKYNDIDCSSKSLLRVIRNLINNRASNTDLFTVLLNNFKTFGITSEPIGEVIDKERFLKMIKDS